VNTDLERLIALQRLDSAAHEARQSRGCHYRADQPAAEEESPARV